MNPPRALSAATVRERLAARTAPNSDQRGTVSPARWRLRESVVLADAFAVDILPDSGESLQTEFIVEDCERVMTSAGSAWRLRADVRRDTVLRLGSAAALLEQAEALCRVSPGDAAAAAAVRYLRGDGRPFLQQSPGELAALLRVVEWLRGVPVDGLPTAEQVRAGLAAVNVLRPLLDVGVSDFVGRTEEILQLDTFLAGPPGSLLVRGLGGMGKSALLAQFLLTRVVDRPETAFVYLSFDHPELRPDRPLSLLAEAARQVAAQWPAGTAFLADIADQARQAQYRDIASAGEVLSSKRGSFDYAERGDRDERSLAVRWAKVEIPRQVWVLDTFEQAQRRGDVAVTRLRRFLQTVSRYTPNVHVIVAGRLPVPELEFAATLVLSGLDLGLARSLLRRRLAGTDVGDDVVDAVVRRVSANPLSLRLAADFLRRNRVTLRPEGKAWDDFLTGLGAEEIQGVLYRRNLEHIPDPDIRAIANPGLVLRVVTPDLIRFVLAGPCRLGELGPQEAVALFDRLADEVLLVQQAGPHVLVHRADVRREMLPLLAADDPDRVEAIHRAAAAYYAADPDPLARSEEIYHLLMLGETTSTLDARWDPSAGQVLLPSLDELPAGSRVYLTEKLGLTADSSDLAESDGLTWSRQAEQEARVLLDAGEARRALNLLRSRPVDVSGDPDQVLVLVTLQAEALTALGQRGAALELVIRYLTDSRVTTPTAVAQLGLVGARIAQDGGDFDRARAMYEVVVGAAGAIGDDITALAAEVGMLRQYRLESGGPVAVAGYVDVRARVEARAQRLSPKDRTANPSLVRELAAELGASDSRLLAEAALLNGIDVGEGAAETLETEGLGHHLRLIRDLAELVDANQPMTSAEQGGAVAERLLAVDDIGLRDAVTEYYRNEVDRAAFSYRNDLSNPSSET